MFYVIFKVVAKVVKRLDVKDMNQAVIQALDVGYRHILSHDSQNCIFGNCIYRNTPLTKSLGMAAEVSVLLLLIRLIEYNNCH